MARHPVIPKFGAFDNFSLSSAISIVTIWKKRNECLFTHNFLECFIWILSTRLRRLWLYKFCVHSVKAKYLFSDAANYPLDAIFYTLPHLGKKNEVAPEQKILPWTSMVVQWIRIRLLMQGTGVRSLAQLDSTRQEATKPARAPQLPSPWL